MARKLAAVEPVPDLPVTQSVAAAARGGSRLDLLVAMRDAIAAQLDEGVQPRDLASLTKRLGDLALEIEKLEAVEGGVVADEPVDDEYTSFDPEAI